ncbi:MAG: hypothetical protein M1833_000784 [Piccolia ochrophora]|nr:MAG: hypothetical protein M1833_000784 [Piccolia ochrophora]
MATYEVEHDIPDPSRSAQTTAQRPRRPDLSTFFTAVSAVDTSSTQNEHAVPTPGDVSAAYRMLADAFQTMQRDGGSGGDGYNNLMEGLIESLMHDAEMPPREVKGVGQEFLDGLERVPKKSLKRSDVCPICNNGFLEDQYPLVVRLPCHKDHRFDLECISPWLKLHSTCPLDRKDLLKKKEPKTTPKVQEEEEWDDMYA